MITDTQRARQPLLQAGLGGLVWIAVLAWKRPNPFETEWAVLLLAFSPLVLVPLVLRLAFAGGPVPGAARLALAFQLPTAGLLTISLLLPAGRLAAALSLPWAATTACVALAGLERIRRRGWRPLPELAVSAGLIYLPIGGCWVVLHAAGLRPLEFKPVIVLLTAIHFHYAGLVLPVLTGLAGRKLGGWFATLAAAGVVLGVPLVAAGITVSQLGGSRLVESAAAWLTALAGLAAAVLHLRLAARSSSPLASRILWSIAALTLAGGMLLAGLYGSRDLVPETWRSTPPFGAEHIDWMRAWHGTANALGFALAGIIGWVASENE